MLKSLSRAALLSCAVVASLSAQAPQTSNGDAGRSLALRFDTFDPTVATPEIPAALRSTDAQRLWIVQFRGIPTQADRDAVAELGGEVLSYLPHDSYVVRMSKDDADALGAVGQVRWVGRYHPAYRVDPEMIADGALGATEVRRFNAVVADKHKDKPALTAKVLAIGGEVVSDHHGSLLFTVALTGAQLQQFAGFDEVLWVDPWSAPEEDMDNARIQGGGNYVEAQAGYTGVGVNAHIYEGIEASHQDFTGPVVNVRSGGAASSHGHSTAGIVFGNGNSNPAVRGMAPDAGKFYTNYSSVVGSRWDVFNDLVNVHDVSHTTASWGSARTFFYTSISAEADDITFDHDLTWTQSQSNAGNQDSRPQAWAKNVFSIGGVRHYNDSNAGNDSWAAGGASIGPASDGRIKPELCAYYDNIGTSAVGGGWSSSFGGTSGATPIVAGHNVLAIEMFTDDSALPGFGAFGNQLRVPGGSSHQNRPHAPTLKALQIVNAAQYSFTSTSSDNRREHQGWGFPDLQAMWDNRAKTFIVDETDVLTQGQVKSWPIAVAAGESSLKVCLHWREPAANPSAAFHLINNLSLRVTSPSGTVYWGNNGLEDGLWSVAGGAEDTINPHECVFVQNPAAGNWNVEVLATAILQDNHVETPAVDADYGLVVRGGTGTQVVFATFGNFGDGCPGSVNVPTPCPELNTNGGALSNDLRDNEYCYEATAAGPMTVSGFDIWTSSTGGTVSVPAHIYLSSGSGPAATPVASTTVTVGPGQAFYTATFNPPVAVNGTFYLGLDTTAQNAYISTLTGGASGVGYWRDPANGTPNWTQSQLVQRPSYRVACNSPGTFLTPSLSNSGSPSLGSTFDVTLSDALGGTFAVLASGYSNTSWSGGALPAPLPGAPGCDLLVDPLTLDLAITSTSGDAAVTFSVPNQANLIGTAAFHQWAVLDAVNPLGIVLSNAGRSGFGN